jgi:uncharacterized protein (DUF58 family)
MTRFRVVFILFILTLIGAFNTRREIYWATTGALFALLMASVIWAYISINWVRVGRRTLNRVAQVGQSIEEEFVIANLSRIPKLWLEVRDASTLPHHFSSRVLGSVMGGKWRGWRVKTICTSRGRFTLGPLKVTTGDPLGIYQRTRKLDHTTSILVYPATFELNSFAIQSNIIGGGDAMRKRVPYVTTNAAGVREYVMGDSMNRIHWPLSMRRGRLVVKEFELDPAAEFWILLDLHKEAHFCAPERDDIEVTNDAQINTINTTTATKLPAVTEEYVISLAASIAKHFLNENKTLGMLAYTDTHRELIQPDRGDRQLNKILERLAIAQAKGNVPFDRIIRAEGLHLPRGSTIVLISASPDPTWGAIASQLSRNGLRVVAVVVDAHSFNPTAPTLEPLLNALSEGLIATKVVRLNDEFRDALGGNNKN